MKYRNIFVIQIRTSVESCWLANPAMTATTTTTTATLRRLLAYEKKTQNENSQQRTLGSSVRGEQATRIGQSLIPFSAIANRIWDCP